MRKVSFGEWMARLERRGGAKLAGERWEDNPDLSRGITERLSFSFANLREIRDNARGEEQPIPLTHLKNIRNFVGAASLMLAIWLGMTFVSDVPPHRYPALGKSSATAQTFPAPVPHLAVTVPDSAKTAVVPR
jgi:hypothetical protein